MSKKIKNRNKRNFIKLSFLSIFSLLTLNFDKPFFIRNFQKRGIRFVKKNKKIWILSQNDFE